MLAFWSSRRFPAGSTSSTRAGKASPAGTWRSWSGETGTALRSSSGACGCPGAPRPRAPFGHNTRVLWEEDLPPGYRMREDADLLVVLRPDGSEVAAFSALGADPLEVIAAAWEDYE